MDTKKALRVAHELGCSVEYVRRTGEKRVAHPGLARSVTIDARRRDAGRRLTTFLRRVALMKGMAEAPKQPVNPGGPGNGNGAAGAVTPDSGAFDPERGHDLVRGFRERFALSVEQLLAEAQLSWKVMKLWRLLSGEHRWTAELIAPFVPVVARRVGLDAEAVWSFLRSDSSHELLSELRACRFWHPTGCAVDQLLALIKDAARHATTWSALLKTVAPWLMPERPMRRSLQAWAAVSRAADDAIHRWVRLCEHIRGMILPEDPDDSGLRGVGMLLEPPFIGSLAGKDMLRLFDAEDFFDLMGSVVNDVVREYGNVLAPADHELPGLEPTLAGWLTGVEDVLLFGDSFLVFRRPSSPVWVSCARTGDAERDRFFDDRVAAVTLLREAVVTDGWDARRSFGWLDQLY
jgi:hypothetical protein